VAKAEKKGRTKEEVDEGIRWLTGYAQAGLEKQLERRNSLREFFDKAPKLKARRWKRYCEVRNK